MDLTLHSICKVFKTKDIARYVVAKSSFQIASVVDAKARRLALAASGYTLILSATSSGGVLLVMEMQPDVQGFGCDSMRF